jgi:uncharacterized Zn-binding protein involved in type VI secretion
MKLTRVAALSAALLVVAACSSTGTPGGNDPGMTSGDNNSEPTTGGDVQTAAPVATFKVIKLAGKGDKVVKFSIPAEVAAIATITNNGRSNFTVESLDAKGSTNDLLVNVIGPYSGTVLFDADFGTHSVAFKIGSSGSWTATIKPISASRAWATSSRLSGKGDDVVLVKPTVSGLATATFTHSGSENFVVQSYSSDSSDLLINEIGHYHGQVQLPDGTMFLSIEADGSWTAIAD